MNLKTIIIDDEYRARAVLSKLINSFCPELDIVDTCEDVEAAVNSIQKHNPDIVFLDVEMPRYSGYEIVDFFDEINFNIIFITAYDKYAIKAFEISAIDYLLKPVEIEKLITAVEKVKRNVVANTYKEKLKLLSEDVLNSKQTFVYHNKGFKNYIEENRIIAFEADGAYTRMHVENAKPMVLAKSIKTIESELIDSKNFQRVHRSWMVNKLHVTKYSKTIQELHLNHNIIARVSRQYKEQAEKFLEQ